MIRKRTHGYCAVMKIEGNVIHLRRDQYGPVRKAWLENVDRIDSIALHGDKCTVRLDNVDSIFDVTPEVVMSVIEEDRADNSDDSISGVTA